MASDPTKKRKREEATCSNCQQPITEPASSDCEHSLCLCCRERRMHTIEEQQEMSGEQPGTSEEQPETSREEPETSGKQGTSGEQHKWSRSHVIPTSAAESFFQDVIPTSAAESFFQDIIPASATMSFFQEDPSDEAPRESEGKQLCKKHGEQCPLFCEVTRKHICRHCEWSPKHRGHNHIRTFMHLQQWERSQHHVQRMEHLRRERNLERDLERLGGEIERRKALGKKIVWRKKSKLKKLEIRRQRARQEHLQRMKRLRREVNQERDLECLGGEREQREPLEKDNDKVKQPESQNLKSGEQSREWQALESAKLWKQVSEHQTEERQRRDVKDTFTRISVPECVSSEPHTDGNNSELHSDVRKKLKIYPVMIGSSSGRAMATLLASKRRRREATCSICGQLKSKPVSFSCRHSCCHQCVESRVDKQPEESSWSLVCPSSQEKLQKTVTKLREQEDQCDSLQLSTGEQTRELKDMKVTLTRGSVPESASSEPRTDCNDSELHCDERKNLKTNEGGATVTAPAAETSGEQPGTSGEQPETSGEQPGTSEYQPETSGEQPNSV